MTSSDMTAYQPGTDRDVGALDLRTRREARYTTFVERYPQWGSTVHLDDLRAADYGRLDKHDHVYLDYTGGGLYGESQVRAHTEFMCDGVFGNPHSNNPTSLAMTDHVEATRLRILEFFNASPDEYTVVLTPNASGALKLVGESYPFRPSGRFAITADNHNSVNGIREFAAIKGAAVNYLPLELDELRLDLDTTRAVLSQTRPGDDLFAFPAQSNFTGVKHPLSLVAEAQALGWDVLLDCAAYAPTSRLDFAEVSPDYATFSFYKMFGYPTGCGCLIAKRSKLAKLDRPWFAGGTIQIASVAASDHFMAHDEAGFEDGTVNYLTVPAIATGLDHLDSIGMDAISTRVHCLTGWLLDQLAELKHSNGAPMAHVHGPADTIDRGGTVTVNLYDPDGSPYSGARIEELAGEAMISLRTGCFCNPGAGESAHQIGRDVLLRFFQRPTDVGFQELAAEVRDMTGKEVSAVRISVGLVSNFADVETLLDFVGSLRDQTWSDLGAADDQADLRDSG